MLKGGVIMDVTTAAEARIAEEAGVIPFPHIRQHQPAAVCSPLPMVSSLALSGYWHSSTISRGVGVLPILAQTPARRNKSSFTGL